MPSSRTKLQRLELKATNATSLGKALGVRESLNMWVDRETNTIGARPPFLKLTYSSFPGSFINTSRADNGPWANLLLTATGTLRGEASCAFAFCRLNQPFGSSNVAASGQTAQAIGFIDLGISRTTAALGLRLTEGKGITDYAGFTSVPWGYAFIAPRVNVPQAKGPSNTMGVASDSYLGVAYGITRTFAYGQVTEPGSILYTSANVEQAIGGSPASNVGVPLSTMYAAGRWMIVYDQSVLIASNTATAFPSGSPLAGFKFNFESGGIGTQGSPTRGAIAYRDKYVVTWTDNSLAAWEILPASLQFVSSTTNIGSPYNYAALTVGNSLVMLTSMGLIRLDQEVFKNNLSFEVILPDYNRHVTDFIQSITDAQKVSSPVYSTEQGIRSFALQSCFLKDHNAIVYVSPLTKEALWVSLPTNSHTGFVSRWTIDVGDREIRGVYAMPYGRHHGSSMPEAFVLHTYANPAGTADTLDKMNAFWVLGDPIVERGIRANQLSGVESSSATRIVKIESEEVVNSSISYVFGDGAFEGTNYTGVEIKDIDFGFSWFPRFPSATGAPTVSVDVIQDTATGVTTTNIPVALDEVLSTKRDSVVEPTLTSTLKNTRTLRIPFIQGGGAEVVLRLNIESQGGFSDRLRGYSTYLDSIYPTIMFRKAEKIDGGPQA
jgi:hypothetical protein